MKSNEISLDGFTCKDEGEAWLAMKSGDTRALIFFLHAKLQKHLL